MAEFCKQCSIELFGEDLRDLADLCHPGEVVGVICEGCGGTFVDSEGVCTYHEQAGGTSRACLQHFSEAVEKVGAN